MQVVVNSLLTNYSKQDKHKKIILFLHGWADTQATFRPLIKELSANYSIITLDLPGFGSTQRPAEPWGLKEYANFVHDFLQKIDCQEVIAVVGHSNGGAIAVEGLASGTLQAQKLVLIASAGVRSTTSQQAHRRIWQAVAKTGKAATMLLPRTTRQKLRRKLYGAAGSEMLIAEGMEETFKKVVQQDVRKEAEKLVQPTLLIYGGQDTATPPEFGEIYHQAIKDSRLEILPDATHFLHQEQAQQVAQEIREFLQ